MPIAHLKGGWWSWTEKHVRGKFYIEGPPACNSNPGRTVLYAVKHDAGDGGGTRVSDVDLGGHRLGLSDLVAAPKVSFAAVVEIGVCAVDYGHRHLPLSASRSYKAQTHL